MNLLPTELRFPKPPFRMEQRVLEEPLPGEVLSLYLSEIGHWRSAVLAFVERPEAERPVRVAGLSERAAKALATCLAEAWSLGMIAWVKVSPYNLSPFPAHVLVAPTEGCWERVLEVLRWRAAVMDMLSDIWDVFDEPELDMDECAAMEQFLNPPWPRQCCPICLAELTPTSDPASQHQCPLISHVRAKWPEPPPAIQRWAEEARRGYDLSPAQGSHPHKWWQFWNR